MRVLIVEDEPLLAMLLEDNLAELGHDLVGSAATVEQALAVLESEQVDCALLDYSLGHEMNSLEIARHLQRTGRPFYFLTGHSHLTCDLPIEAPMLEKPVTLDQLQHALKAMDLAVHTSAH